MINQCNRSIVVLVSNKFSPGWPLSDLVNGYLAGQRPAKAYSCTCTGRCPYL